MMHRAQLQWLMSLGGATNSVDLWHARMGHPSYKVMKAAAEHSVGQGLPKALLQVSGSIKHDCESCGTSKATRRPFALVKSVRDEFPPGAVWWRDRLGPLTRGLRGEVWAELYVNETTNYMAVFMAPSKESAVSCANVLDLARTELRPFGRELTTLRSDRAAEYTSLESLEFAREQALRTEFAPPGAGLKASFK